VGSFQHWMSYYYFHSLDVQMQGLSFSLEQSKKTAKGVINIAFFIKSPHGTIVVEMKLLFPE
jgi:hypothetical protein